MRAFIKAFRIMFYMNSVKRVFRLSEHVFQYVLADFLIHGYYT
jgi:hypothetical protein